MGSYLNSFDYLIKILLIGNPGVGKSSLIYRYCEAKFPLKVNSTKGIKFKTKIVTKNDRRMNLQIWDISGQERFRSLASAYFRGSQGFVLVYDIADETSFSSIKDWLDLLRGEVWNSAVGILVGNKADLQDKRAIAFADGEKLARKHNLLFIEASAADDQHVADVFERLATHICDKLFAQEEAERSNAHAARNVTNVETTLSERITDAGKVDTNFDGADAGNPKSRCFIF